LATDLIELLVLLHLLLLAFASAWLVLRTLRLVAADVSYFPILMLGFCMVATFLFLFLCMLIFCRCMNVWLLVVECAAVAAAAAFQLLPGCSPWLPL
jgi:hypothetical protein